MNDDHIKHINDPEIDLEAIRASVERKTDDTLSRSAGEPVRFIDQGNRMIRWFETWLLDDEQKQVVNSMPWGFLILCAGSYLHDICLIENGGPDVDILMDGINERSEADAAVQSWFARSGELIRSKWQELGIADEDIAGIIARVCLLAGNPEADNPANAKSATIDPDGRIVDVHLLAACLRLCKALDLNAASTRIQIYSHLPEDCQISTGRMTDHFTAVDVGAHPYLAGTIRLKIQCRHPEIHRALKHHERSVQRLLESLNHSVRPRFLYSDVIYEIEPDGYTPIDLKFSVDSSAGLQLFKGNRLYSDKRAFLRELVQNAVDACNYRKLADADYSPAITIEFNEDISTIKVRDNGIGMTQQWIEKYFLAIGISFYQSNEIRHINRESRIDFGFISQFGIGFLSSFQVAQKIVIKTRKAGFAGMMISITDLRDYFDVRVLEEDYPAGTEVTLHLKASKIKYCRSMEYVGYLKTNIRFLQIPVTLIDSSGNSDTIGREELAYVTDKRAGTVFVAALNFPRSEGFVRLGAKNSGAGIHALESSDGGVSIFQDGIFVTQERTLLPEGARQYVVARINLLGADKCELSMDRNRVFWTADELQNIKKIIRHGLVDVANQLMSAIQSQDVHVNALNSIVNHLAIFFEFSDVDDEMYSRLSEPIRRVVVKRFRDFIRINFAHTQRSNLTTEADGYGERWQQQVLMSFAK